MREKEKRVLIMIDQATRDGLSQLLVAHYLKCKGVKVLLCNQATVMSMCERYRPDVLFASWTGDPSLGAYLRSRRHRIHIVLLDQEGGRLGKAAYERFMSFHREIFNNARNATKIIVWGTSQAQWLREMGCPDEGRIVVTGCPRYDPYLTHEETAKPRAKYIGVTLRADFVTGVPMKIMEGLFRSISVDPQRGLSPFMPLRMQYEDWVWQDLAITRYMFKLIVELSKRTSAPIVLRPGPWEQYKMYKFLSDQIPQVSIEPSVVQHEYVKNAFVTIDSFSALGLESLLAGVPVISTISLEPRLEEHVGGEGGARLNPPYRDFYWQPKTVEEAVEYVLKAERGELPLTPCSEGMQEYFHDLYSWPSNRPNSFNIGDTILELMDLPAGSHLESYKGDQVNKITALKRSIYRYVPASASLAKAMYFGRFLVLSRDRQFFKRYHYFDWTYPSHKETAKVFTSLWNKYEATAPQRVA